jgi:Phage virion morphogenesis family.
MQDELIQNILNDINVSLKEKFDKNFENKGFFNERWARRKFEYPKGSLMMRSGNLRKSIRSKITGNQICFYTNLGYATIHNEGGEITVTRKMKGYFWAMYMKETGKRSYGKKAGRGRKSKTRKQESDIALFYISMALKKEGSKIQIPKRQFIGKYPGMETTIRRIIEHAAKEYINNLKLFKK